MTVVPPPAAGQCRCELIDGFVQGHWDSCLVGVLDRLARVQQPDTDRTTP